jgi:hypothetical protein
VEPFEVGYASCLDVETERAEWLVEGLWSAEGVGVIGGAPKCCKTWLALDLALSVASGTDALGRFPVSEPGTVLLYAAEDAAPQLRERLDAIAVARRISLAGLPLGIILAPSLRLDSPRDLERLHRTLDEHRPSLLVLDPLVRLHRIDENSAGEMSAMLGELRTMQRRHRVAIALVHHLRKSGAAGGQAGQALRGSGDLHAWGDSNLYLRKRDQRLKLLVEHRSAPAPEPCLLELCSDPAPHLRLVDGDDSPRPRAAADLAERIVALLAAADGSMSREDLRVATRSRNATLGEALIRLRAEGLIERSEDGFRLAADAIPVPTNAVCGNGNGNGNAPATKQRPSA